MPSPSTPIDWQKQIIGDFLLCYINYPLIMGSDLSGTIVEVSPDAKRIQINDRVVAEGNSTGGAFQHHTLVHEHMASPLPDYVSHEQACVVPLTLYCTTVLKQHPHTARKFIAMASGRGGASPSATSYTLSSVRPSSSSPCKLSILKQTVPSRFIGVMVKFIDFKDSCEPDGPVARIYKGYLSRALA